MDFRTFNALEEAYAEDDFAKFVMICEQAGIDTEGLNESNWGKWGSIIGGGPMAMAGYGLGKGAQYLYNKATGNDPKDQRNWGTIGANITGGPAAWVGYGAGKMAEKGYNKMMPWLQDAWKNRDTGQGGQDPNGGVNPDQPNQPVNPQQGGATPNQQQQAPAPPPQSGQQQQGGATPEIRNQVVNLQKQLQHMTQQLQQITMAMGQT